MFRTVTTAAILVLSLALPAVAQTGPSVIVHFGDLDLSRPADVQLLDRRIDTAAATACANLLSKRTSNFYQHWFANCVGQTSAQTSAHIASLSSGKYRAVASK